MLAAMVLEHESWNKLTSMESVPQQEAGVAWEHIEEASFDRVLSALLVSDVAWTWDSEAEKIAIVGFDEIDFRSSLEPSIDRLPFLPEKLTLAIMRFEHEQGMESWDDDLPGWYRLVESGYLKGVPKNPLSPDDVATKLILTDDPRISGSDVDPNETGWLYNTSHQFVYAAGLDSH